MSYRIEQVSTNSELSASKRALLELRLSGRKRETLSPSTIIRCPKCPYYPLSSAQRRLWLHQQLAPDSVAYNIQLVLHLEGDLNVGALEEAFSKVLFRHQVLRTTIDMVDGEPIAVIGPPHHITLQPVHFSVLSNSEGEFRLKQLIMDEAGKTFDLRHGPLLRLRLLQIAANTHVLLITMHHIVGDGWSLSVLFREMLALYNAFSQGQPNRLPPLPIQYTDFVCWEHGHRQSEPMKCS